ncbi:hypothetical protein DL769_000635 [Monosporascus sp. CRB-8-3]|nr:hypothetical protein DL769_000635 [Monosporascus sp. CRB-8-3]
MPPATTVINIPSGPGFEPTANAPIVTRDMKEMLEAVDEGCLLDLFIIIIERAQANNAEGVHPDMRNLIRDVDSRRKVVELVHSIPRRLIKGMVLGITALQHNLPGDHPLHVAERVYNHDGPGVYVASIAVAGRSGRGWTGAELGRIIRSIEKYVEAWTSLERLAGSKPTTPVDKELANFAAQVDAQLRVGSATRTKKVMYISGGIQKDKVEAVLGTLKHMRAGLADDVESAQLLSYYGCSSTSAHKRPEAHTPAKGWYQGKGNHPYWLLMSVMKRIGIEPEVKPKTVIRTWEFGQLRLAETVGTMLGLGGSLVEDWGLNVQSPGGKPDNPDHDFTMDELAATVWNPWLRSQLEETATLVKRRLELNEKLDRAFDICGETWGSMRAETERNAEDVEGVKPKTAKLRSILALTRRKLSELASRLRADVNQGSDFVAIVDELLDNLRGAERWMTYEEGASSPAWL